MRNHHARGSRHDGGSHHQGSERPRYQACGPYVYRGSRGNYEGTQARMEALLAYQATETTTTTPTRRLTNPYCMTLASASTPTSMSTTTSRIVYLHTSTWKFNAGSSMTPSTALPAPPEHHPLPTPLDFVLSRQYYEPSDGLQVSRSLGWIYMMAKPNPSSG